ncbi:hypothetical protein [Streptomyces sp. NPDC059076]|uniref:hypothetical protein n=1 Tax=unclassified Streptomyces TaxID=2593676 RepID=UPI00368030BE
MSAITATAAAVEAGVTVATVRAWCRRGVIAAQKAGGRWAIEAASLTRRIAIGAMRATRKEVPVATAPIQLTSQTSRVHGHVGAVGPADVLKTAFETGTQITLSGRFAGERVYLGHTRTTYDDGLSTETIGLDRELGPVAKLPGVIAAVYLVDLTRLDDAPLLAEKVRQTEARKTARAWAAENRAQAEDTRYLNRQVY